MKNKITRIPDTELEIMQVIWSNPTPISTSEVKKVLEKKRAWSAGALQTLLNRLIDRGFLKGEMRGKSKTYSPLVKEDDYIAVESRSFLKKLGGNSITSLVASLYDSKSISDEDLKELNDFIESARRNG
ncbi:MAG: BlaI/MecI/CopY family transcriptional regulator [Firmicutes bacterium]|nr:BlaI/MecI/CopY family transcriptional regulator [Bacillota bacterium]